MSVSNQPEIREFQTEIRQLLDIVIHSLYTDRQIFLRELISNGADALEKLRYAQLTGKEIYDKDIPLEISVEGNEEGHTLTISDTGIGMTKDELVENLGTIAHSGSKALLRQLAENDQETKLDLNLIGQFGVGFYSAFMVADKVTLYTRSYQPEAQGWIWTSEGTGSYELSEGEDISRGTRIVLHLKSDAGEFTQKDGLKRIIKQYSSFVPYPILLHGEKVNTVQALWTKNKNEISEEEYNDFYQFATNSYDEPLMRLHFSSDAPISLNALLYVPKDNFERFGFGRLEPGVNLYCKKVLIEEKCKDILPEWLRFIKGVVDSEELPLNISRETMQDSTLLNKLKMLVTGRFLKFLDQQAADEPEKYKEFWEKFGVFIKEGAATDYGHREELTKLLRFESSKTEEGKLTSLAEYIERMAEHQEAIYYVNGPTREVIEGGPYLEIFRDKNLEVIYTHEAVDDYIFEHLGEFKGKKLVSADQADLELPQGEAASEDKEAKAGEEALDQDELNELTAWLKETLGEKVTDVRVSQRLTESPAIALSSGGTYSMQRMMQLMNKDMGIMPGVLEINARHKIIRRLNILRKTGDGFAPVVAEQILQNAQIAAGMIMDPRNMVNRLYQILERALGEDHE